MPGQIYYGDPVDRAHPLNRGLVSWWLPLPWYSSGPRLIDIAAMSHGTLTNGPTWVPGLPGQSELRGLKTVGADCGFVHAAPANLQNTSASVIWHGVVHGTVSSAGASFAGVTYNANIGDAPYLAYDIGNSGTTPGLLGEWNDNGTYRALGSSYTPTVGVPVWYCLTVTSGVAVGYVNGAQFSTSASASSILYGTPQVQVGRYLSSGRDANWTTYSAAIYNRALSALDVALLYDQARRGYPNLLRRLRGFSAGFAVATTSFTKLVGSGGLAGVGGSIVGPGGLVG